MTRRQEITDKQWETLAPLFPEPKGVGRPPLDMRETVEGIAWRFRTGAPWRDVPERFGKWNSIYQRFSDWTADGTWARVLATAQQAAAAEGEVDWTVSVDASIARVHPARREPSPRHRGMDRTTRNPRRIPPCATANQSRLTTRSAAPGVV